MESPLRLTPLECTQAHSHHEQNKTQTVAVNLTQCDCLYPCPFHIVFFIPWYIHSMHLKIIHTMHLKMHLPWYMNRKNTLYWSQISGIMEHLTSCGVYIHSMHLKLHLPWYMKIKNTLYWNQISGYHGTVLPALIIILQDVILFFFICLFH
jgi:hypothetical protein